MSFLRHVVSWFVDLDSPICLSVGFFFFGMMMVMVHALFGRRRIKCNV